MKEIKKLLSLASENEDECHYTRSLLVTLKHSQPSWKRVNKRKETVEKRIFLEKKLHLSNFKGKTYCLKALWNLKTIYSKTLIKLTQFEKTGPIDNFFYSAGKSKSFFETWRRSLLNVTQHFSCSIIEFTFLWSNKEIKSQIKRKTVNADEFKKTCLKHRCMTLRLTGYNFCWCSKNSLNTISAIKHWAEISDLYRKKWPRTKTQLKNKRAAHDDIEIGAPLGNWGRPKTDTARTSH